MWKTKEFFFCRMQLLNCCNWRRFAILKIAATNILLFAFSLKHQNEWFYIIERLIDSNQTIVAKWTLIFDEYENYRVIVTENTKRVMTFTWKLP